MSERAEQLYRVVPNTKVRAHKSDTWKPRPCWVKYCAFRDTLRSQGVTIGDGDFVTFYMPLPKSASKAERARLLGTPHRARPDLDNLLGGLMDAARKTSAGEDDSNIAMLGGISKVWALEGAIRIVPGPAHW